jgi:hypothetical protein
MNRQGAKNAKGKEKETTKQKLRPARSATLVCLLSCNLLFFLGVLGALAVHFRISDHEPEHLPAASAPCA